MGSVWRIAHIAADLGMHPEDGRKRVRQAEADSGVRPDLPASQEREEPKLLRLRIAADVGGHSGGWSLLDIKREGWTVSLELGASNLGGWKIAEAFVQARR